MDKITSKLNYLKGLLKGMELNGGEKNVIIEEIIDILDIMNESFIQNSVSEALPTIQSKSVEYDYFNDKTMKRSDFSPSIDSADIWYDESVSMSKASENSVYKPAQKSVLERICKHCGTYIRAEFSIDEYQRVKIQCPKCKHFILPEENFIQDAYNDKTFQWDDNDDEEDGLREEDVLRFDELFPENVQAEEKNMELDKAKKEMEIALQNVQSHTDSSVPENDIIFNDDSSQIENSEPGNDYSQSDNIDFLNEVNSMDSFDSEDEFLHVEENDYSTLDLENGSDYIDLEQDYAFLDLEQEDSSSDLEQENVSYGLEQEDNFLNVETEDRNLYLEQEDSFVDTEQEDEFLSVEDSIVQVEDDILFNESEDSEYNLSIDENEDAVENELELARQELKNLEFNQEENSEVQADSIENITIDDNVENAPPSVELIGETIDNIKLAFYQDRKNAEEQEEAKEEIVTEKKEIVENIEIKQDKPKKTQSGFFRSLFRK